LRKLDPVAAAAGEEPLAAAKSTAEEAEPGMLAGPRRRPLAGRALPVRLLEELSYRVAQATALLALLLTLCVIGALLLQVFFRYVLDEPLAWTDEAAIFFFAWLMLLLATIGVRERTHVRFTFIVNALPRRLAGAIDILIMLLITAFGAVLVTTGQDLLDLVWGNLSPAVHYPLQALYVSLPIVGALLVLHAVTNLAIGPAMPGRES
jgi:TRAP-type C4-dicarboxylate transport system permease small subunit